jgi:putative ABC transport system permease protein
MTRGQIIRLILAEAAALGGLGGALGIGIGSWISYYAVSNSAAAVGYDFPYVLPVEAILISVGIALFVPLMAGLWPAWYGARSNVVQAIRSE